MTNEYLHLINQPDRRVCHPVAMQVKAYIVALLKNEMFSYKYNK
jgi:hypothetical protein